MPAMGFPGIRPNADDAVNLRLLRKKEGCRQPVPGLHEGSDRQRRLEEVVNLAGGADPTGFSESDSTGMSPGSCGRNFPL